MNLLFLQSEGMFREPPISSSYHFLVSKNWKGVDVYVNALATSLTLPQERSFFLFIFCVTVCPQAHSCSLGVLVLSLLICQEANSAPTSAAAALVLTF